MILHRHRHRHRHRHPTPSCARRTCAWGVVALAASVGGCADDSVAPEPVPPPITWQGENVALGNDDSSREICGGTLPYLDHLTGALRREFGTGQQPEMITYNWLIPERVPEFCSGEACARGASVFSSSLPHEHELVHAVRSALGLSASPLEEGAAVIWGDERYLENYGPADRSDTWPMLESAGGEGFDPQHYLVAGELVAYVIERFGEAGFDQLTRQTDYGTSLGELEIAMVQVLGVELDDVVADFMGAPTCSYGGSRRMFLDCDRDPIQIVEGVVHSHEIDCDGDAVGADSSIMWTTTTVEIPTDGEYAFAPAFEASVPTPTGWLSEGRARLMRCGPCDGYAFVEVPIPEDTPSMWSLPAGRYVLRFRVDRRLPGRVDVTWTQGS